MGRTARSPATGRPTGFTTALLAALCALTAACGDTRRENELVVSVGGGTWEQAQRKAFFEPFTRDTGIRVVLVPEDHAKLLASVKIGRPEVDLASIPGSHLAAFTRSDAIEPIDYRHFSARTLAGIPPKLKAANGVGSIFYSTVIAFNTRKFPPGSPQPRTWADFYDVDAFPGPRALPACEKMVDGGLLEGALMADGVAPEDVYPIDLDRAFRKLARLRAHVSRWWIAGADAPQSLIDGEVDVAAAYNGRVIAARQQGAPLDLSWIQSLLQYDYWVVTKNAPNKENAMRFLAYVSQPQPQAEFVREIAFGPVNTDAFALLPGALGESLPGSPGLAARQLLQDYTWWNTVDGSGRTNWDRALERCVAEATASGGARPTVVEWYAGIMPGRDDSTTRLLPPQSN